MLLLALGVTSPVWQTGCKSYIITDPVTGASRPTTPEEMAALWGPTAVATGSAIAMALPPPWQQYAQLGIQIAALTLAWFTKKPAEIPKAVTKGKVQT
jgi:hypothetical protein